MIRAVLIAGVLALCVGGAASQNPVGDAIADYASSVGKIVNGITTLQRNDAFEDDSINQYITSETNGVISATAMLLNDTFSDYYNEFVDRFAGMGSDSDSSAGVSAGVIDLGLGLVQLSAASQGIINNAMVMDMLANSTAYGSLLLLNTRIVQLVEKVNEQLAGNGVLVSESNRRRLAECNDIDWETVAADPDMLAELTSECLTAALNEASTNLDTTTNSMFTASYEAYCEPYVRSSYSEDLLDDMDDDKTIQTCMDTFGCFECLEADDDEGELLTQQDCSRFGKDEQQWMLDPADGGSRETGPFRIVSDEDDDLCITAPGSDGTYYRVQECDADNSLQVFDVKELSVGGFLRDPRIFMVEQGTGNCMTAEKYDDDEGVKFVSRPCGCLWQQIFARDD